MSFQAAGHDAAPLSVEEAQARVLAEVVPGAVEHVALEEAPGRVLREDHVSPLDMPASDNSGMDGYAVRAADLAGATRESPVRLRVIADIPAGRVADRVVEPATAMRIMTGAWVPAGADTVVQVELTDGGDESVAIYAGLRAGSNIRRRGEDIRAGDVVLEAGTRLGATETAMLASLGARTVLVARRPVVAILSTGDELVELGEPVPPGRIVNSNAYLLATLVREAGAVPRDLGIVPDSLEATITALESAMESDFVLSSGGVSVGAYDFIKEALSALGAETKFWRVAMKPGKPFVLSRRGSSLCFGLPGNPVSCFVGWHLFVAPALRKATGESGPPISVPVGMRLDATLRPAADRRVYFRARVFVRDGVLHASPMVSQSSGALSSMSGANGLVVVEPGTAAIDAGSSVPVILLALPVSGS